MPNINGRDGVALQRTPWFFFLISGLWLDLLIASFLVPFDLSLPLTLYILSNATCVSQRWKCYLNLTKPKCLESGFSSYVTT